MTREIKFRIYDPEEGMCNVSYINLEKANESRPLPLMQYTGLKDKNGVEIYDGDILGGIVGGGFVCWLESEARFAIDILGEYHEIDFSELQQQDLEVIGNIYDNPELLEVEHGK